MVDQLSMLNPAAKAVVYPVNPDLKVLPASPADPVNPVLLANLETLASHQLLHANQQLHHHANPAHKDLPAHQVHPDLPETQERLVLLADLDMMLLLEPLDHVDHPALLVNPALLDHLASLVFPLLLCHLFLALLENPEISDHLDLLDHLANPVWTAHQDLLDQRENLDFPVITVLMEIKDLQAHLDQLVLPARRVSARNTVPSMVVSSSKTALVVNFFNRVSASFTRSAPKQLHGRCGSHPQADHNNILYRVDDVPTSSLYFSLMLHLFVFALFIYSHTPVHLCLSTQNLKNYLFINSSAC
jgi:hypothetical protein